MGPETTNSDLQRRWREFLEEAQPAEWVREMIDHYHRTGTYRSEDLWRLLGDPVKGVEAESYPSLARFLSSRAERSDK